MSPLHSALALGPLATYLLLLGIINLTGRPRLTTGTRDILALGLALTGFFVVGPLDLFMPVAAANLLGPRIWVVLVVLYWLGVLFVALTMRPRLVIYNMTLDELRPILAAMIERLGIEHSWAGRSLSLPGWGVELHLDRFVMMRNVTLVASGPHQSPQGWRRLRDALQDQLATAEVAPNPIGLSLATFGLLILASLMLRLWHDPAAVAHSLFDLLRM